jgi:flagellar basal-body rod protein FlgF
LNREKAVMPYGLYISAEWAHAQAKRLEVIANNMANVDTVGFKRELALFQARYAEEIQQGYGSPGDGSLDDVGGGIMVAQTKTDFSPGPMKRTGIPTDMAIEGTGFFVVQKDGQNYLTRAGNFRLTSRGELVTQQGYPVLGEGGAAVVLQRPNEPFQVTPSGTIQQGGDRRDLAIVEPASPGDLVRAGENLFRPLAEPSPVSAQERRVAGGYLEMSGVRPTMEMIDLIETSRVLEANTNMMKAQDEMLGGLISRVMRTA